MHRTPDPGRIRRAIRPGEGQDDFPRRIVDNAVTMQCIRRIAYRFRHPVTYFLNRARGEALVRTRERAPFSARGRPLLDSSEKE